MANSKNTRKNGSQGLVQVQNTNQQTTNDRIENQPIVTNRREILKWIGITGAIVVPIASSISSFIIFRNDVNEIKSSDTSQTAIITQLRIDLGALNAKLTTIDQHLPTFNAIRPDTLRHQ